MDWTLFLIALAVLATVWLIRRGPLDPASRTNEQLLMEYTVHLHKLGRSTRLNRLPLMGAGSDSPAARELARRGIDPDKAIDERFDARRANRPMDWDTCRLGAGGWSPRWKP